uniref:mitogen-activated protein kinase n=1 Tax=Paramormyrops kingsleyae TaxID=1676925 RepID=A0A3B3T4Q1_9TELE
MASPVKPGFYRQEIQKTTWDVPERYAALRAVGSGAYGTVCCAVDQNTKEKVAIKKLYRPFQSLILAKRAYRELRLLRHIQHDNVICLLNVFTPDSSLEKFQTFYMVMPFVAQDLSHIMKRKKLTDHISTYLFYQILRGLKYIHSAGIIHRVSIHDCPFILDFGLARHTESEMTGYVVTRWYRAPEVIFNWMHYTQTVDVWSAGCILAEMITGQVLFPGNDSLDQLQKILSLTGTPQPALVQKMQSADVQAGPRCTLTHMPLAMLEAMLVLDPEKRIIASEGLSHPFVEEFHDPDAEPESPPYDDSFESMELVVGEWKSLIHMEIMTFDPDNPRATAI